MKRSAFEQGFDSALSYLMAGENAELSNVNSRLTVFYDIDFLRQHQVDFLKVISTTQEAYSIKRQWCCKSPCNPSLDKAAFLQIIWRAFDAHSPRLLTRALTVLTVTGETNHEGLR